MTPRKGSRNRFASIALVVAACVLGAGAGVAGEVHHFANGIRATIHTAGEIEDLLLSTGGTTLVLADGGSASLELSADKTVWYPFDADVVAGALAGMAGFHADVDVDVYILPLPPAQTGSSFALRDAIFLAPGFGPVNAETVASITAHEMGHVLTWACLDGRPERWQAYMDLRCLDPHVHNAAAAHAWRPREILAEDLRFLFGGPRANHTGTIENAELVLPDRVVGLRELLVSFLQDPGSPRRTVVATAFPNPCNPRTSLHLALPAGTADGGVARVAIYDVRGARVRTLTGGRFANDAVTVVWDGTDASGRLVASGQYMYVISAAGHTARGSVTLVR